MKIMVVDDSKTTRLLIKKALMEMGYSIITFCNSAESALNKLQFDKPDLILLDWHMTGITGLEFLKQIKGQKKLKKIPVIMLTSEGDASNVTSAVENGAEDYLLKPVNKKFLQLQLKKIEAGL